VSTWTMIIILMLENAMQNHKFLSTQAQIFQLIFSNAFFPTATLLGFGEEKMHLCLWLCFSFLCSPHHHLLSNSATEMSCQILV
jgi:hypothetical protein